MKTSQVEQACIALSSLAADVSLAMQLIKSDILQPIESVLKSFAEEEVISVLQVVVTMAFASDSVAQKMLTKDILKSLKALCSHKNAEVNADMTLSMQEFTISKVFSKLGSKNGTPSGG